jgi:hypothetical protein
MKRWFARRQVKNGLGRGFRPQLDMLEDRTVPSTLSVPAYSSLPGAKATIYLNFLGENVGSWLGYNNVNIPAFDQNGDPTTFTSSELNSIQQIWQNVAEDYSPFNINVTTVDPQTLAGYTGEVSKIDIGGNGSWAGGGGGIAQVGGFGSSSASNPVRGFVFPANLLNGNPADTADDTSHEAGHNLGLDHQSQWSGSTLTAEYYKGPGDGTGPIMGYGFETRSLWWYGTSDVSPTTYQNDMAVIAGNPNVGYRPDNFGHSIGTATPLAVSGNQVSISGIIGQMSTVDYFSFASGAGQITLTESDPAPSRNLSAQIELFDANGTLLASAGPNASFSASITTTLSSGGIYYVMVASTGRSSGSTSTNYGFNVGQYQLTGSVVTTTNLVNAPTNLTASANGSTNQISLHWTDSATNATGYTVQSSSDGVNWVTLTNSLSATATSYSDTSLSAGTTREYRVQAYNATTVSLYSNIATGTTVTAAPTGLTATAASAGQINLTWVNVAGETGFQILRSTDGLTWTQIGTTGSGVTSYQNTGLSASTTYYYEVKAVDAGGSSAPSNQASATTSATVSAPSAPSNLTATVTSATSVVLAWKDNSTNEAGFAVEVSTNGKSWTVVVQVGTGVTSYTDAALVARKTYAFRVRAFNSGGYSAYSNVVKVTTPKHGPVPGSSSSFLSPGTFPEIGQGSIAANMPLAPQTESLDLATQPESSNDAVPRNSIWTKQAASPPKGTHTSLTGSELWEAVTGSAFDAHQWLD